MSWFRVDDDFSHHHKVVAAGNAAIGMWVRAGSWSAKMVTEGFIPQHMVSMLGTIAQARKLVSVGLWVEVEGGFRFHEWTDRQPSKKEVDERREAARDRMRAARERKKRTRPESSEPVDNRIAEPCNANITERIPRTITSTTDNVVTAENPETAGSEDAFARTNAHVRDVFARSSHNPIPSHPIPISTYVGGVSHESNARDENEPPRKCSNHLNDDSDRPCRACGVARRASEAWYAQRLARERADAAAQRSAAARAGASSRRSEIANCNLCDDGGYDHGRVCHHDPEQAATNAAGVARVREALATRSAR